MEASAPVGVPKITQVVGRMLSPAGKAGVATQLVIAAPLLFIVVGVTDIATPTLLVVPAEPVKLKVGAEE